MHEGSFLETTQYVWGSHGTKRIECYEHGWLMRVHVTGVAGFLGSHIADALIERGHSVSGSDNLSAGDLRNIPSSVAFHNVDCLKPAGLFVDVDVLYHCAAHPHEGLSVFSPRVVTQSIYDMSVAVFSEAIAAGVKRIVYCSSMSRYGDGETPFRETQSVRPRDPYAIAKVAAEETLRCLCEAHGLEYVIAVPHNIVGARQKYDDPFRNVCAIMINRMLLGMQPIVYGDGHQTRCFSDVRDVVRVMVAFAEHKQAHAEIFNVGPDEHPVSIERMGQTVAEIIGCGWNPMRLPPRLREVRHAHCSSDKIRTWYDYRTEHTLTDMLESLVAHVRALGPKPFDYYLPIEIKNENTPRFWTERI